MRKLLLLLAASLVVSCGESTSPSSALVITAASSASAIRARQNVTITLTIFNPGDTDLRVALGGCQRPFEVRTTFGAVVGPAEYQVCSLALIAPTTVPAGGSVTYETQWAGDSRNGPADEVIYLDPGPYLISPKVQIVESGEIAFGKPIAITIQPE